MNSLRNLWCRFKKIIFVGMVIWIGGMYLFPFNSLFQAVIRKEYDTVERILKGDIENRSIIVNQKNLERIMNYSDFISSRSRIEIEKLLREIFGDYEFRNLNNWAPLNWAVFNNDLPMVKLLIRYDANPNGYDSIDATPLHWAALWSDIEIIKELIYQDAKVFIRDKEGFTPLYRALQREPSKRDLRILQFFIEYGAKVTRSDKQGRNAFHIAASKSYFKALDYLTFINRNLLNSLDDMDNNALHWAVSSKTAQENLQTVKKLVNMGVYTSVKNSSGLNPFHLAVFRKNIPVVKYFIEINLDPNAPSDAGNTPLHIAARWGYDEVIRLFYNLLGRGVNSRNSIRPPEIVNPNYKNKQGHPPLNVALYNNNVFAAVELTKFKNLNPLVYDSAGENGLHLGARSYNLELMKKLLERARYFNEKEMFVLENKRGQRPIEAAVWNGDTDMVIFLIQRGGLISTQQPDITRLLANARTVEMERMLLKLRNNPQAFVSD